MEQEQLNTSPSSSTGSDNYQQNKAGFTVDIDDTFFCPLCLLPPPQEMYLCKNGHSICSMCSEDSLECYKCGVSYSNLKARNYQLESIYDTVKYGCVYGEWGCIEYFSRHELQEHQQTCRFNNKFIHFCQTVSPDGDECGSTLCTLCSDISVNHFSNFHGFKKKDLQKREDGLGYDSIVEFHRYRRAKVLIIKDEPIGQKPFSASFLIVMSYTWDEGRTSFITFFLGDADHWSFSVQYRIKGNTPEHDDINITVPVTPMLMAFDAIQMPLFSLPQTRFQNCHFEIDDDIVNVHVTILPLCKNTEQ